MEGGETVLPLLRCRRSSCEVYTFGYCDYFRLTTGRGGVTVTEEDAATGDGEPTEECCPAARGSGENLTVEAASDAAAGTTSGISGGAH